MYSIKGIPLFYGTLPVPNRIYVKDSVIVLTFRVCQPDIQWGHA